MGMIDCASKLTVASCQTLVKNGVTQVGRYLPTSEWKALSLAEVETIKKNGLKIISIYEQGATKASYFTKEQGMSDAAKATLLAKSLEQPEGTAIYFTVDYDAQTKDFAGILNYFQGLKDNLKSYKLGAYGKFEVMVLLQTKNLADYFWQTYAWSGGQHAKNLHLFQYKNDTKAYGLAFGIDLVNIEKSECGAWGGKMTVKEKVTVKTPEKVATPKPKVTTYRVVFGDTLSGIAEKFKTTTTNLQLLNKLDNPHLIYVGQVLKVTGNATKPPDQMKYKIQDGDTLTSLAKRQKTTVDYLMRMNPKISNPNKIYVGQTINIPK